MIITKLIGGLGNQMFQYAAGRSVALRKEDTYKLDISGFEFQNKLDTPRSYELNIFNIKAGIATPREIEKLKQRNGSFLHNVVKNRIPLVAKYIFPDSKSYYSENIYHRFESRILTISGDAYLEGWWHSEKYFREFEEIIRKDFTFKKPLQEKYGRLIKDVRKDGSVSLHVRLGDYVGKYRGYFSECSPGYYEKAIKAIAKKTRIRKIFIICEDISWIKNNLKIDYGYAYLPKAESKRDWQDCLRLMSFCDHQIIANSSYSWWGAWLNSNPHKVVAAPSKWFVEPKLDTKDLIPSSWIKI